MGAAGAAPGTRARSSLRSLACPDLACSPHRRMSAKSKGNPSSSSAAEGPPAASKTKVKEQIKIIVEDLELVLGDLKDVAKELKEVRGAGVGEGVGLPAPLGWVPVPLLAWDYSISKLLVTVEGCLQTDFLCSGYS